MTTPSKTIPALFLEAVETYDKPDAVLQQRGGVYVKVSHRDLRAAVENATRGLLTLGLVKGDRIALLSENRLEWVIADLATLSAGCVTVPVYPTLPPRQVEFILRDSEVRAVFVSTREQLEKIDALRKNLPNVQHVFSFERIEGGEGLTTLDELIGSGAGAKPSAFDDRLATIGDDDWASVIYTSGTTGDPKGAILTHGNFVANVASCTEALHIGPEDRCLSLLPLSHAFERTAGYYAALHRGSTIAYPEKVTEVAEKMRGVRPTFLLCVPRFFEKTYAKIFHTATTGSPIKRRLFFWAVRVGKTYAAQSTAKDLRTSTRTKRWLAEVLVFRKLKAQMGGRIRFFTSGGAALSKDIAEFFVAVGLPILEGYGLTETAPVVAVNTFEHLKLGTVGKPVPRVDVRIADDGEILVKGPNVMHGYFKQPDRTREVLVDGWFHTGDIGHIDDDGFLVITDRKKDIIVTAGGKNVSPQLVEGVLTTSSYISQVLLIGNDRKFVSAIIVPNFENIVAFAKASGIPFENESDLLVHPLAIGKIGEEIEQKSEHLASFERVKKFILADREFSVEENELTPTLKLKRRVIETRYKKEIDELYAE